MKFFDLQRFADISIGTGITNTVISGRSEMKNTYTKSLNAIMDEMFRKYDKTFRILAEEGEENDQGRGFGNS